jgi:N-acetylglucosaminyl-diphospho-decaprenol L-rhamnosyltransferase
MSLTAGPENRREAPPLRVVIVHWNQPEDCLATIERFRALEVPVRVTVVDNASSPTARDRLRSGLPDDVELIESATNTGFGPGANLGLRRFLDDADDGDWVVLAPHDVEPAAGCLEAMVGAAAGEPMAGLMCADVGDGMVPVIDPYFGGMFVPGGTSPGWEDAAYPHGTLMMLRRACLDEVGVFDERYFSYCEEADLGLRARRRGWKVGLVRGAMVTNLNLGSSVPMVDYLQTRNTLLLVQEMSGWYHAFVRAVITVWQIRRGMRDPASRPPVFDARARMLGLRDFGLRRFGPPPADLG